MQHLIILPILVIYGDLVFMLTTAIPKLNKASFIAL